MLRGIREERSIETLIRVLEGSADVRPLRSAGVDVTRRPAPSQAAPHRQTSIEGCIHRPELRLSCISVDGEVAHCQ